MTLKKIALPFILTCSIIFSAIAQQSTGPIFIVNEVQGVMSQGEQVGQEIIIQEVNAKEVEKALYKWGKSFKAKVSSAKGSTEIFIDNAMIPAVSENTIDIYTIVLSVPENGATLKTYVDLGGSFLTSADHPQAFTAMENEIISFAKNQMIAFAEENIKTEEKHLAKLESEFKSLQKDKSNYERDIQNNTDNIAKREQEIIQNEQDQKSKEQQIAIQQDIVRAAKDKRTSMGSQVDPDTKKLLDNQVKNEEKNLKSFENQLKSLHSDLTSAVKDIEKSKSTIAQREQDIIKNIEDQKTKEQQIELQKKILEMVKQKRAEIR